MKVSLRRKLFLTAFAAAICAGNVVYARALMAEQVGKCPGLTECKVHSDCTSIPGCVMCQPNVGVSYCSDSM